MATLSAPQLLSSLLLLLLSSSALTFSPSAPRILSPRARQALSSSVPQPLSSPSPQPSALTKLSCSASSGAEGSGCEDEACAVPIRRTETKDGAKVPSMLAAMAAREKGSSIKPQVTPAEMAEMRAAAAESSEEAFQEQRRQVALAIASPLVGAALFAFNRATPADPVATLRRLEAKSPPLQAALASGRPTLIEFYAKWCGDCKAMASSMEKLESEYGGGKINFVVIDAERKDMAELVGVFRVDAIPHFAFVSPDRKLQTTLTGFLPKKVMEKQLSSFSAGTQLPFCGPDLCGLDPSRVERGTPEATEAKL